jgi:anti-anti-sigma factor
MDVYPSGHDQGRSIITVTGDIDLATADDLRLRLIALIGPARRNIGLDLSGVTFIDCAGLRTLTAVHTHLSANGAGLRLTRMSPVVARLLELVNATGGTTPPAVSLALVPSRPAHTEPCSTGTPDPATAPQFEAAAA